MERNLKLLILFFIFMINYLCVSQSNYIDLNIKEIKVNKIEQIQFNNISKKLTVLWKFEKRQLRNKVFKSFEIGNESIVIAGTYFDESDYKEAFEKAQKKDELVYKEIFNSLYINEKDIFVTKINKDGILIDFKNIDNNKVDDIINFYKNDNNFFLVNKSSQDGGGVNYKNLLTKFNEDLNYHIYGLEKFGTVDQSLMNNYYFNYEEINNNGIVAVYHFNNNSFIKIINYRNKYEIFPVGVINYKDKVLFYHNLMMYLFIDSDNNFKTNYYYNIFLNKNNVIFNPKKVFSLNDNSILNIGACGYKNKNVRKNFIYLFKINNKFKPDWFIYREHEKNLEINDVIEVKDGYIIVGRRGKEIESKMFIFKIDSKGAVLWDMILELPGVVRSELNGIVKNCGGTFTIIGTISKPYISSITGEQKGNAEYLYVAKMHE